MLRRLEITRFKSVRSLTLEFGRVNLFIGGNGAGKSNILEAIGISSACFSRGLTDSDIGAKGMRITPPELMKSSFKNEELPKTLELKSEFSNEIEYKAVLLSRENDPFLRFFSESSSIDGHKIFGRSNRGARATGVSHADRLDSNRGIWDQIKATYDMPLRAVAEFLEFSKFAIYTPQTDFLRGRQKGKLDAPPIGLHGEGLPEAVDSFLSYWRKLITKADKGNERDQLELDLVNSAIKLVWLPGWASQFGTGRSKSILTSRDIADRSGKIVFFNDKFMHANRNQLSVYDSSEGTLFLLFAVILLTHPESPKIFALDNIDNALNPKLTRKLVERVIEITKVSNNSNLPVGARQVFLTSHNPTSLDAFDLFDDENRVFIVKRNERGHTIADRLVPPKGMTKEQWNIATAGRNLSQLWLDGEIKGALGSDGI